MAAKKQESFTLMVLLKSLYGCQVRLELKDDQEITGTVDEVTSNLNLVLINVKHVSSTVNTSN